MAQKGGIADLPYLIANGEVAPTAVILSVPTERGGLDPGGHFGYKSNHAIRMDTEVHPRED